MVTGNSPQDIAESNWAILEISRGIAARFFCETYHIQVNGKHISHVGYYLRWSVSSTLENHFSRRIPPSTFSTLLHRLPPAGCRNDSSEIFLRVSADVHFRIETTLSPYRLEFLIFFIWYDGFGGKKWSNIDGYL